MDVNNIIAWCKVIILMVLIIAGGMVAVNQTFGWYYKVELLGGACKICADVNPEVSKCIYPTPMQFNFSNIKIEKIK